MRIWVDADACPKPIKEILFRAAARERIPVTLVANRELYTPRSPYVSFVRVPHGFDRADRHIAGAMEPGDLVVTADVPLAAEVLGHGGHALNPRGRLFTEENIQEALAMRDLSDRLRDAGIDTGGPPPLGKSDRQSFANELDRWLARHHRRKANPT